MTPPILLPDIWRQIFLFLHITPPLPYATPNPPRQSILQPHLAILMRISRPFYSIAAPILYRHIISDAPYLLFAGVYAAGVKGVIPKVQLFGYTQKLQLEYGSDPRSAKAMQLAYTDHLEWLSVLGAMTLGQIREVQRMRGKGETDGLAEAWRNALAEYDRPESIFKRLSALTIGAIFRIPHGEPSSSRSFTRWHDPLFAVEEGLGELSRLNGVQHYCELSCGPLTTRHRGMEMGVGQGPLRYSVPWPRAPDRTITTHSCSEEPQNAQISADWRTRMYSHYAPLGPDDSRRESLCWKIDEGEVGEWMNGGMEDARDMSWELYAILPPVDFLPLSIEGQKDVWRLEAATMYKRLCEGYT